MNKEQTGAERIRKRLTPLKRRKARRKMEIASQIKARLDEMGWSQRRLATELGKKPSEISRLLRGDHNMTIDSLCAVEEALGLDVIQFPMEHKGHSFEVVHTNPSQAQENKPPQS